LSAELRERTGIDNGYLCSGGLDFSGSDAVAEKEWRTEGVAFEIVEGSGLRRLEPALGPGVQKAYFLPGMAQLRNPRHIKALLAGCGTLGVELRPGCPVDRFLIKGTRILAAQSGADLLPATRFLIAAGAWSEALLDSVCCGRGIHPVR